MGHGWMAISPTEVQSHCNFLEVTGGHEVVIDGPLRELSEELDSMSDEAEEETNDFPEKKRKCKKRKLEYSKQGP
jgi:hypothetical protein